MKYTDIAPGIFTVQDFLDTSEREEFIRMAEQQAFEPAPIITATGAKVQGETRNNDRLVFDDVALASQLWLRLRPYISESLGNRSPLELNERFRLYRYVPGQRFKWHADAPFKRPNGDISLLTFMIYLNSGYEGGATRFEAAKVSGQQGLALVFQHGLIHEGAEVTSGVKYVLRSDVMFGAEMRNGG